MSLRRCFHGFDSAVVSSSVVGKSSSSFKCTNHDAYLILRPDHLRNRLSLSAKLCSRCQAASKLFHNNPLLQHSSCLIKTTNEFSRSQNAGPPPSDINDCSYEHSNTLRFDGITNGLKRNVSRNLASAASEQLDFGQILCYYPDV